MDKLLWKVMKKASGLIIPPLVYLKITPNQLTAGSSIINFSLAAFCFYQGTFSGNIAGLFFLILHSYFDFADGTLARATGKTTKIGAWLDAKLDVLGTEIVLMSLVAGTLRTDPTFLWIVISSFAVFGHLGILSIVFEYDRFLYRETELFNERFNTGPKMTVFNWLIKEFITLRSFPFLFLGTFRYFLTLMLILNQVKLFLLIIAIFNNLRWVVMFWSYVLAGSENKTNQRVILLLREFIQKNVQKDGRY